MADLATIVQQMPAVYIVAPTARNGVTLMQRLLNSTGQAMIFGENYYFIENLPHLVHSLAATHTQSGQAVAASRQRFASGETEYWSSDLNPDTQAMMLIGFEAFYKTVAVYQQTAQQCGRNRWGVKNPITTPQSIERLHILMPAAKFIFIYRNVFDVIRSAKARRFVNHPIELEQYVMRWTKNTQAVLNADWPHVMPLRYETLVAEPEPQIARIEQFTGLTGVDRSVMQRKINTFTGPIEQGASPTGYVPPEELTEEEQQCVQRIAGDQMAQLNYVT